MAELPENIRRPGGDLVSAKRPHGRRLLLPTEVELCNLLNLSEDEYWYFVDTTAAYNGTRPKGYELIPDIRCDPISSLITTKVLVQIGIAVAAATVSYLLTPKPKEQKQGGSKRTADSIGNKRFAPQAAFDSVQELAILGDAIPLIFANTDEKSGYGGIRVNSQLLWSQFLSMGKYQQLKVLGLFSLGQIPTKINGVNHPNYEGFGIGDTLLNTYNSHKVGLYFKGNGGRIASSQRYPSSDLEAHNSGDPFILTIPTSGSSTTHKGFSGARNPSTQVTFGAYAPVPNAQIVKLPYELVLSVRGASKAAGYDTARKRKKIEFAHWPSRCGVIKVTRNGSLRPRTTTAPIDAQVNDVVEYQVVGGLTGGQIKNTLQRVYDTNPHEEGYQEQDAREKGGYNFDAWGYKPHGVDDVDSMTISIRENADALFAKGEQYLFGTAVMQCTQINDPVPYTTEKGKGYVFKVVEAGRIDIPVANANLATHCDNPRWHDPGPSRNKEAAYSLSDRTPILYKQIISGIENYGRGQRDLYYGHDIYTCQKVAFATVSNNRDCHITEIGIKSKVFKQMRFSNVNSQPGQDALDRAYEDRTQIQLGQVDRYLPRMSFFMLQARRIGQTTWYDMKNSTVSNHTGLFAVRGNSPEFQYNTITIEQPLGQFEYRFKPYPGNYFTRDGNFEKRVNLLVPTTDENYKTMHHFTSNIRGDRFNVIFPGIEDQIISENDPFISNKDWNIEASQRIERGQVQSVKYDRTNATEWRSHRDYTPQPTGQWVSKGIINNPSWRIKYNDSITNPFVTPPDYIWNLYPLELDAKASGGDPGFPGAGRWPNVFFLHNGKRYQPTQIDSAGNPTKEGDHPDGKYYLFYVEVFEWENVAPTPIFDDSVAIIHGPDYDNDGDGNLHVELTVYRDDTETSDIEEMKYYAKWNLDLQNRGSGYKTEGNGSNLFIPAIVSGVQILPAPLQVDIVVGEITIDVPGKNLNRFDVIKDWNIYEGDINSNKNEPEHQISFVNEILKTDVAAQYTDLAYAGLVINSSKEWTNFSQFSAYFKKGIEIERLITSGTSSSNLFPEIAYSLLTSSKIGAGELVGTVSVDKDSMTDAAKFCKANDFFWDGVISSKLNLRDFIFEHAGYCLLDFTIIGGKFSLKPTVPINGSFEIDKNKKPDIKCLFTDGNINDLQVAFLSPEERQLFKAAVLYRKETENGFPETKSMLIRSTFGTDKDPIETFDLSGFCTSKEQAKTFAKYAINLRRLSDHGITFKTAPQYIQHLGPGDYFRLVSEVTHTSRFRNGAKLDDGTIVSKDDMTGSETVYYWIPGREGEIRTSTLSQAPAGCLFTVKNSTTENKVYKCETISYGEEGLIEVSGSYAPTEASTGYLSVLQNWDVNFSVIED